MEKISLCQFYELSIRKLKYNSWNQFVSVTNKSEVTRIKEILKKQYKEITCAQ
jgi:hypothetical protein